MILYGLRGFTHHGWSHLLTVMSPQGATRALAHIEAPETIRVRAAPGTLTRYYELRDGALDTLIDTYGIEVMERARWDELKSQLGESIYR